MSLKSAEDLPAGASVEVSFSLLTLPRVWVRGTVSWRKGKSFGVRFDATDERRQKVKEWIDAYLGKLILCGDGHFCPGRRSNHEGKDVDLSINPTVSKRLPRFPFPLQ